MKLLDADNQHHVEFSLEKAICAKMVCYPCAIGQGAEKSRQKEQPSAFFSTCLGHFFQHRVVVILNNN